MKLKDRVCVVTGSSSGIGKEIARRLALDGASVVVTYNSKEDSAKKFTKKLTSNTDKHLCLHLDVTKRSSIEKLRDTVIEKFGKINVLVNNSGILKQTNFLDISDEEWDEIFSVNLGGVFKCSQILIPELLKNQDSRIINISSFAGKFGGPKAPHYSASKAGVICLTKSLARLYSSKGLLVNTVAPGVIATDMFKSSSKSSVNKDSKINDSKGGSIENDILIGSVGESQDIAGVISFLASDDAKYVTGATFDINGGLYLS